MKSLRQITITILQETSTIPVNNWHYFRHKLTGIVSPKCWWKRMPLSEEEWRTQKIIKKQQLVEVLLNRILHLEMNTKSTVYDTCYPLYVRHVA